MSNQPTISDAQRAEWATWMESWRNLATTDGLEGSAATALAVNERFGWLEADHARLVEHTASLLKDRNEWQAAYRAEQERHDATIHELQEALTERARLKDDLQRQVQEMVDRHQTEGGEWLEQLAAARLDADTAKGEVARLAEENRRLAEAQRRSEEALRLAYHLLWRSGLTSNKAAEKNDTDEAVAVLRAALASPEAIRE